MRIKYIIIEHIYPVIISEAHTHAQAARVEGGKVTSAGCFSLEYDKETNQLKSRVFGESVSLGLKPGPHDDKILNHLFRKKY